MSVIHEIKKNLPAMRDAIPPDINVDFELDQSPFVTRAVAGVVTGSVYERGDRGPRE